MQPALVKVLKKFILLNLLAIKLNFVVKIILILFVNTWMLVCFSNGE